MKPSPSFDDMLSAASEWCSYHRDGKVIIEADGKTYEAGEVRVSPRLLQTLDREVCRLYAESGIKQDVQDYGFARADGSIDTEEAIGIFHIFDRDMLYAYNDLLTLRTYVRKTKRVIGVPAVLLNSLLHHLGHYSETRKRNALIETADRLHKRLYESFTPAEE